MDLPSFAEFFSAAHGQDPFPWQVALADRVAAQGWPQAFQVPTGLGKTAVLDVALWALGQQAELPPQQRQAHTRTFLIVDRRLVVDQAYDRARALAEALGVATAGPLQAIAWALRLIGEPDEWRGESLLSVTRMRGGATWASQWIRRPDLPAIVVGTVDQLGSRALFRGYGVGPRRLPIDAALVGTDALVIIDEVHLSRPCRETLTTLAGYEARVAQPVTRPIQLVSMSATLPEPGSETLLTDADWLHPVAGARLRAEKFARLVQTEARQAPAVLAALAGAHLAALDGSGAAAGHGLDSAKADQEGSNEGADREEAGREGVPRVLREGPSDVVGVVVNTVGLARAVFDRLTREGVEAVLAVGRVRGADRDRLQAQLAPFLVPGAGTQLPRVAAGGQPTGQASPAPRVLVATQTVEVGVDIDLGALVTQVAPLDSLVQRLGRLDRLGARGRTEVTIVRTSGEDPVYGPPAAATWEILTQRAFATTLAGPPASLDDAGPATLDLGTEGLGRNLAGVDRQVLVARTEGGPVVLPPIADVWARTAPVPVPDEPVAAYLHGLERPSPMVAVAWRAVAESTTDSLAGSVRLLPLRPDELVEVPLWEAVSFLQGRKPPPPAGPDATDADVASPPPDLTEDPIALACVRVDGDTVIPVEQPQTLRPGDQVVVASSAGGYDQWGWTGRSGGLVPDLADACNPGGTLRLQPAVLASLGVDDAGLHALWSAVPSGRRQQDPDREPPGATDLASMVRPLVERVRDALRGQGTRPLPPAAWIGDALHLDTAALPGRGVTVKRGVTISLLGESPAAAPSRDGKTHGERGAQADGTTQAGSGDRAGRPQVGSAALSRDNEAEDSSDWGVLLRWRPGEEEDQPRGQDHSHAGVPARPAAARSASGRPGTAPSGVAAGPDGSGDLAAQKGAEELEIDDEADLATSLVGGGYVELTQHCRAVAARAEGICRRLGLPEALGEAVCLAAAAHDLGKADPRFQLSLWEGDRLAMEADGRVLAKSVHRSERHTGDWPRGLRHEAVSVSVLEEFLDRSGAPVDRDLVHHLVLAHHGFARPLLPGRDVREPTSFVAPLADGSGIASAGISSQVDWEHPGRFSALCHRYGWWGLAMLETILRAADTTISEEGG